MKANFEVFRKLCDERGLTIYQVSKDTGLKSAMLYHWEKGRYRPKVDKVAILAKYFHVKLEEFYV